MTCTAASVALLFLMTMGVALSQTPEIKDQQMDRLVGDIMNCAKIQSISLAFTSTDTKRPSYVKSFTKLTDGSTRSTGSQRIFCIGGATQAFTAVLLAKLLNKHPNVTWDTPIRDIVNHRIALPYQYLSDNLNLKDIFAMRSGLTGMDIVTVAKPYSVDELIEKLRYVPPVAGFREKTIYNEVLFSLLEEVVQVLGGDTWQNLTRQHIFQPLQMTSTTFLGPAVFANQNLVKGLVQYSNDKIHELSEGSYSGLELVAPAVSVCTTAEDIQRWLNFILNDGKVDNKVIVDSAALQATYEFIQARGKGADPVLQNIGFTHYSRVGNALGWINGFYGGSAFISQDGSIPGYQTLATIVPSMKYGVYVAFNGDHGDKRVAAKVLLNTLGFEYLTDNRNSMTSSNPCNIINNAEKMGVSPMRKNQENIQRTLTPVPRPLEDYVGSYSNYAYGEVRVNRTADASKDSGLTLKYGLADYILYTTNKNNTFQLMVTTGVLWYSTNADWYRLNQEIFAEFFPDPQEPDGRFTSVRINGFDRNDIPEFSINAQPPRYERSSDYYRCSAPGLAAWQWTILLVITIMYFS